MNFEDTDELMDHIHETLRRVGFAFPFLVGLLQKINVHLDDRVGTAGIFATGRLLLNPDFVSPLSRQDLFFVLAHELYHLMLRTHQRGEGSHALSFSFAHDYIINDILCCELGLNHVPAGGLTLPGARRMTAEMLMVRNQYSNLQSWQQSRKPAGGQNGKLNAEELDPPNRKVFEELLKQPKGQVLVYENLRKLQSSRQNDVGSAPKAEHRCDVLDDETERKMFPELSADSQAVQAEAVAEAADGAQSMQSMMEGGLGRGDDPLGSEHMVDAIRRAYRPPWELGLQKWLESMTPTERSYARPSRRGADRTDVVLPGRKREGWTVHIVLDTSGSMTNEIPEALGAIAVFCEAMNVEEIHLIQCDAAIQEDQILSPSQLARWKVTGYGGSDLRPAMERLAERLDVEAVIVLTDGDIAYPPDSQPYQVLWVLPSRVPLTQFRPPYGKVVSMNRTGARP